eukprot:5857996-Alexandrium_andersonii.AAC.1
MYDAASDHFAIHCVIAEGSRERRLGTTGRPQISLFGWKCVDADKFGQYSQLAWGQSGHDFVKFC